jgi:mannobiose 2-epimerase
MFLQRIISPVNSHLRLFFDEDWTCRSSTYSFGHDIECSWLLCEAAAAICDSKLQEQVVQAALALAEAAAEGIFPDGGLASDYDCETEIYSKYYEWWQQAEGVVGFYNAYQLSGDAKFLSYSKKLMNFIAEKFVDYENGEWRWGIFADGTPDSEKPKAGFWKCPYHNGRMCLEMMKRLPDLSNS